MARHTGVVPTDADLQDHPATPEEQRREFEDLWVTATPVEDVLSDLRAKIDAAS
jgi:hypothetical protein